MKVRIWKWLSALIAAVVTVILICWNRFASIPPATTATDRSINVASSSPASFSPSPVASTPYTAMPTTTPTQPEGLIKALSKPISFFGKVIDQTGIPIAGAKAEWRANSNSDPFGRGTEGQAVTDGRGTFSVRAAGISLYVKVSKQGYYELPDTLDGVNGSSAHFSNAEVRGNTDRPMGTEITPAVFVLRAKGEPTQLIHVNERPVSVPKNGTPIELVLEQGDVVAPGIGNFRIQCWTQDEKKDPQGRYPWRCRVAVPGGGLLRREDDFAFQAPADGYKPEDEIVPDNEHWMAVGERQYFVKMGDGRFARVNLRMRTGGDHFAVIESYINRDAGSRNLEYDPEK